MKKGSVRLYLPNGEKTYLGNPESTDPEEFHKAVIQVRNPVFFKKSVLNGDLGFAESYMDGDWDTDDIRAVISWFIYNVETSPSISGSANRFAHLSLMNLGNRLLHLFRRNSLRGSKKNIVEHYDLGNDFYKKFLDATMTYSCAYFSANDQSLEAAQIAKLDLLSKKLRLKPDDHLLEIGTGWGGLSTYAAKEYGCKVTTYTISEEQFRYAQNKIKEEGLSDKVEVRKDDYRNVSGSYDKLVTVEMLEAVGHEYFESFFEMCNRVLKKDGVMAHQIITSPDSRYESFRNGVDFIQKHIFPGSLLPSIGRINEAINRTGNFHLFDLEDMGTNYDRTLMTWLKRFDSNIELVRDMGFDESFLRKWRYYFSYCAAAFATRNISVVQAVYIRPNNLNF
ncbi:class I SAM-dependent methyltransferase [Leptospira gomenensis]|uniref:Class I SAM-dependent methyltransferase n=1 Tax=Leptospira gomenensis TaxID=2484974 RepID=A0A5F1YQ88_9LEPT|nr:class I SAM-dependent methyltransferase [Leptospira gomenensis]TGK38497.1 class I SAM-dependent methyltransferase [Leptospira gomenensis]TGK52256.1 class I SAM-dependent methyltransferase [Leptospira gomenensis]TGK59923.1 class I SAM-dependent methyltransferase [Leptospira gomenensis]